MATNLLALAQTCPHRLRQNGAVRKVRCHQLTQPKFDCDHWGEPCTLRPNHVAGLRDCLTCEVTLGRAEPQPPGGSTPGSD